MPENTKPKKYVETTRKITFDEVAMYIEEARIVDSTTPIFKLGDLADVYRSRMGQLRIKLGARVNTTRLKKILFSQIPDLQAQAGGGGRLSCII